MKGELLPIETKFIGSTVYSFSRSKIQKLVGISDFHKSVRHSEHTYRADVITDKGVVYSTPITCTEPAFICLDTEDCAFYRVEIFDTLRDKRIAIGNPIWNDR